MSRGKQHEDKSWPYAVSQTVGRGVSVVDVEPRLAIPRWALHDSAQATTKETPALVAAITRARSAAVCMRDTALAKMMDAVCSGVNAGHAVRERAAAKRLVYVYRGSSLLHTSIGEVVADASQVLLVNPGEPYRISHSYANGSACLELTLDAALLREIAPPGILCSGDPSRFKVSHLRIDPRAQVLVALIRHSLRGGTADPREIECLALTLVLRSLGRRTTRAISAPYSRRRLVDRAKLVLGRDPSRRWTLTDVAREVGVSPAYLTKSFREVEGVPLYQYQLRLRLARALDLLGEAGAVGSLGHDLGFSSHSHFSASFQQLYGRTPTEFREMVFRR